MPAASAPVIWATQVLESLAKSGIHPKMAQDLARHSTIDLTMNHYTHLQLRDRSAALKGLPSLLTPGGKEARRATGTDGAYTPLTQPSDGESGKAMADEGKKAKKASGPGEAPAGGAA